MSAYALLVDRVLTDDGFAKGSCVIVQDGQIVSIVSAADCPVDIERANLTGDLVPGFIDLQVNGGGGVLLNDRPSVEGIRKIAEAHRTFGTTGLLPTLISDDLDTISRAIAAVDQAIAAGVPGILGIHLEGPFLNARKKGIHDASKFRTLDEAALDLITSLKNGKTLVTLAPELVAHDMIHSLNARGVIVAAGHTAATYEEMEAALACGVSGFTHLFNAMPVMESRAPGAVGAALGSPSAWCSVIVDGHHVHPAMLRIALAAKGAERIVLVTDAMPSVGSTKDSFDLGGQTIAAIGGKCVSADGTLAGADLNMAQAVRNASLMMNVPIESAIRMASANPAAALGISDKSGAIRPGLSANFALLDARGFVSATWIDGVEYRPAEGSTT